MIINEQQRKAIEIERRAKLKAEKPLVYEKIIKYDQKVANGESTAIIDFCFDYKCNMHCAHCCNLSFEKKEREMSIEDLKEVARQADELGLAQFNISGGEPLTFNNLDEIVEALNPEKFHIAISSNGVLLTEEKAQHLKKIGVDKIRISIDNFNAEKYMETRGTSDAYNKAITALFNAKKANMQTGINTMVSHQSCRMPETEQLAKFADENGFNLDILIARAIGAWEGKEEVLITSEDNEYLMELRNKYPVLTRDTYPTYGQNRGCGTVKHILHMTKYGDILPCAFIHISLGNVLDEPLEDIIKRGLSIKWFNQHQPLCLSGEHREFIQNYMSKFYGKPLPISYKEAFSEKDYIKK